jgi:hypothetical protein
MLNKKICFFMGVYKDQHFAKLRLQELNSIYGEGEVDIVVISDGIVDEDFAEFCKGIHSLHYEVAERRKCSIEYGGEWIERFIKKCLELSNFDILIKIDPDTKLFRKFKYIPPEQYFGSIRFKRNSLEQYVQGGCKGLTRKACVEILNSGFLRDEQYYGNNKFAYRRFSNTYLRENEEAESTLVMVEDAVLLDAVKRLALTIGHWDDVNCWTPTFAPSNLMDGDYAAVHPVYGS